MIAAPVSSANLLHNFIDVAVLMAIVLHRHIYVRSSMGMVIDVMICASNTPIDKAAIPRLALAKHVTIITSILR